MTAVAAAVERREWELLALRLLLGVSAAARRLPPEALTALIDLLATAEAPREASDGG